MFNPLITYIAQQNNWKFDIPQSVFNHVEKNLHGFKIDKSAEQNTVPRKWSGETVRIDNTAGFANQSKIKKSIPNTVKVSSNKHWYTKPSVNLHIKYVNGKAVFNSMPDFTIKKESISCSLSQAR